MTLTEASEELLHYFINNDTFLMSKNFVDIIKITEDRENDEAILYAALDYLETSKLLTKTVKHADPANVNSRDELLYILNRSLFNLEQTVNLPGELCFRIYETLSKFSDEEHGPFPDPLKIGILEIEGLVDILDALTNNEKCPDCGGLISDHEEHEEGGEEEE